MQTMQDRYFPYRRLGYTGNPFRALTIKEWRWIAVLPAEVVEAIQTGSPVVQILGPSGAGKSSALHALARDCERASRPFRYTYLPPGGAPRAPRLLRIGLNLLDEAQRLRKGARLRLARSLAPKIRLIYSTHEDLRRDLQTAGSPIPSIQLDRPTLGRTREIIERRLQAFAIPGQPRATFTEGALLALNKRFGNDLGAMEAALYELFTQLRYPRAIDVGDLEPAARP